MGLPVIWAFVRRPPSCLADIINFLRGNKNGFPPTPLNSCKLAWSVASPHRGHWSIFLPGGRTSQLFPVLGLRWLHCQLVSALPPHCWPDISYSRAVPQLKQRE